MAAPVQIESMDTHKKNSKEVMEAICKKNGLQIEFGSGLQPSSRNNGMFYSFGYSYAQLFNEMLKITAAS